ncbi:hypothetical protein [Pseudoduganella aquatica]|uniref:hypothetical protein n=1 Tax=Pseudoduganella aquatica TaxID=2660641 RepID=UPI001E2F21A6|nr:hypothetical protein [Pseudoduganella aquatica]
MKAQAISDIIQLVMAGTRQMEMHALIATAKNIDSPPIRATECAWFFCTPPKSKSSAGPCNFASLMTSKVSSADAIKLTKNENIIIYQYKIPERVVIRNTASPAERPGAAGF